MVGSSKKTEQLINKIFLKDDRPEVKELITNQCSNNLPFCNNCNSEELERIRFAVLKVSDEQINKLLEAVCLAQIDWRDLLVRAGFENDISLHEIWANMCLKK